MPFVLDASVAAAWILPDEHDADALKLLESIDGGTVLVPPIWPFEIRNILLKAERRGRISPAAFDSYLTEIEVLPIDIRQVAGSRSMMDIARRHRLTAYDASYIQIAMEADLPLATLDRRLAEMAAAERIPLLIDT